MMGRAGTLVLPARWAEMVRAGASPGPARAARVGTGGTTVGAGGKTVGTGGKDTGSQAGSGSAAGPNDPTPGATSCSSDTECPGNGEPCQMCADGHSVCHDGYCDGPMGTCKVKGGYCAVGCAKDADCPASNLPCTDCGNGAQACPTTNAKPAFVKYRIRAAPTTILAAGRDAAGSARPAKAPAALLP